VLGQIAGKCPTNPADCALPNCHCSSESLKNPGGFKLEETPQMVYLTFDDALTRLHYDEFFSKILFSRSNPNGAKISATFFITHEYNDYKLAHELWRRGHEIALHSTTHQSNTDYWKGMNVSGWDAEVLEQKKQIAHFAKIPEAQIVGFRAPFLQTGGNIMYESLSKGLKYECSRPTLAYIDPGLWPYTNDYESIQDCQIQPCPTHAFPGFWTFPMIDMIGDDGFPCAMVDTCNPQPNTTDQAFDLLKRNFEKQYNGNRAPFGVFTHAAWLQTPAKHDGYVKFIDWLITTAAAKKDIYIVSLAKALEWLKNPTKIENLGTFAPWAPRADERDQCSPSLSCRFGAPEETPPTIPSERYMMSCPAPCPPKYPWLHNWDGTGDYQ